MDCDYILTIVYQGQYRELAGHTLTLIAYLVDQALMSADDATCLFVDACIRGEAHREWPVEVHVERAW